MCSVNKVYTYLVPFSLFSRSWGLDPAGTLELRISLCTEFFVFYIRIYRFQSQESFASKGRREAHPPQTLFYERQSMRSVCEAAYVCHVSHLDTSLHWSHFTNYVVRGGFIRCMPHGSFNRTCTWRDETSNFWLVPCVTHMFRISLIRGNL